MDCNVAISPEWWFYPGGQYGLQEMHHHKEPLCHHQLLRSHHFLLPSSSSASTLAPSIKLRHTIAMETTAQWFLGELEWWKQCLAAGFRGQHLRGDLCWMHWLGRFSNEAPTLNTSDPHLTFHLPYQPLNLPQYRTLRRTTYTPYGVHLPGLTGKSGWPSLAIFERSTDPSVTANSLSRGLRELMSAYVMVGLLLTGLSTACLLVCLVNISPRTGLPTNYPPTYWSTYKLSPQLLVCLQTIPPLTGLPTNYPPLTGLPTNYPPTYWSTYKLSPHLLVCLQTIPHLLVYLQTIPPITGLPTNYPPLTGLPTNYPPAYWSAYKLSPHLLVYLQTIPPITGLPTNYPPTYWSTYKLSPQLLICLQTIPPLTGLPTIQPTYTLVHTWFIHLYHPINLLLVYTYLYLLVNPQPTECHPYLIYIWNANPISLRPVAINVISLKIPGSLILLK